MRSLRIASFATSARSATGCICCTCWQSTRRAGLPPGGVPGLFSCSACCSRWFLPASVIGSWSALSCGSRSALRVGSRLSHRLAESLRSLNWFGRVPECQRGKQPCPSRTHQRLTALAHHPEHRLHRGNELGNDAADLLLQRVPPLQSPASAFTAAFTCTHHYTRLH